MMVIPAVDLRAGDCVQLVGGSYAHERIRIDDPAAVARQWAEIGFRRLHVVDLDAATGAGDNTATIGTILAGRAAAIQVGGGVRSAERVRDLMAAGADLVIVGTRAVEDREWLAETVAEYPDRIIVAADVWERRVATHGWAHTQKWDVLDFVRDLHSLPLGGLLVTAVHLEGQMMGTDLPLMTDVAAASPFPVIASGGVTTVADIRELKQRGIAAAVVGMALYTGALDGRAIAEEFGA